MNAAGPQISREIVPAATIRRLCHYALGGAGLFSAIVLLLHFFRPEYDPVTRFISEYAVTDPVVACVAAVSLALGSMALIRALTLALPREHRSRAGMLLLWIYAVCFTGVGFFPADEFPTINPPSWHGIVHAILGLISFSCFSAGSLLVSLRLRRSPSWNKTAPLLITLAALNVAFFFIFYGGLEHIIGLIERIYVVFIIGWIVLVARKLMSDATATAAGGAAAPPALQ